MGVSSLNEFEMQNILERTVRYFQESKHLDRDGTRRMIRSLSDSQFFRDVWPDIAETRRADLTEQVIHLFDLSGTFLA